MHNVLSMTKKDLKEKVIVEATEKKLIKLIEKAVELNK